MRSLASCVCVCTLALAGGKALADNWNVYLTVDNQFDVYYGTSMTTTFAAGGGTNWMVEYNFTATGRPTTDYLYVATSSDYSGAQGFIGTFHNTTLSATLSTGTKGWQVFPAGKYLQQIFGMSGAWPVSQMPTQSEVDAAIAYATTNNLWVAPTTAPGYDNDPSTPISPYTFIWPTPLPNIQTSAQWIWYDSGNDTSLSPAVPAPLRGFNHDEFLVFRVPGAVPEPVSAVLLGVGAVLLGRRRGSVRG